MKIYGILFRGKAEERRLDRLPYFCELRRTWTSSSGFTSLQFSSKDAELKQRYRWFFYKQTSARRADGSHANGCIKNTWRVDESCKDQLENNNG